MSKSVDTKSIPELLAEYQPKMEKLLAALGGDFVLHPEKDQLEEYEIPYDRLWLLRFVLSNDDTKKAAEAVRQTLKWRRDNEEILRNVRRNGMEAIPYDQLIRSYVLSDMHKNTKAGNPVFLVRAGISNPKKLLDQLAAKEGDNNGQEAFVNWFTFQREFSFYMCDRLTRKTGKIVKLIGIVDMNNSPAIPDRRFFTLLGKSGKRVEFFYPQLLGMTVMINMPSWFNALYTVLKPLMPKRTLEKVKYCRGKTLKEDIVKCPYATNMIRDEDIPTFLGGKCNCPSGCVRGVPNSQTDLVNQTI